MGFSADLAKDLEKGPAVKTAGDPVQRGEAQASEPRSGDAAKSGDADKPGEAAKSGEAKAGEARAGEAAKSGEGKAGEAAKSGEAKAGEAAKSGEAKAGEARAGEAAKSGEAKAGAAAQAAASNPARTGPTMQPAASMPSRTPPSRGPVKIPADLAAIKLSLLPNWDRDIDEAGTFQYVVRIKGTQNTKTFSFRYGYDDPQAPTDREQYKKYLQDARVMTGEIKDRQRGSAWLLEGNDASGHPAFRYVVLYGGKRLICHGSMYRDAESNPLGDDRDQTVIQAKQICESLAL